SSGATERPAFDDSLPLEARNQAAPSEQDPTLSVETNPDHARQEPTAPRASEPAARPATSAPEARVTAETSRVVSVDAPPVQSQESAELQEPLDPQEAAEPVVQ